MQRRPSAASAPAVRVLLAVALLLSTPLRQARGEQQPAAASGGGGGSGAAAGSGNGTSAHGSRAPAPAGGAQPPASAAPYGGHKPIWPLLPIDIGLFVVVAVALFIASGAGVGGGVLLVPALLLIGGFNAIVSVALSNMTILASSVANIIFNVPRRSPLRPTGPLIDWDLVLLFGPPTVVGSIAGSYVNMVIPSWVTKVTLFLLLVPMTWRMVEKAVFLHKKETALRREQSELTFIAAPQPGAGKAGAGGGCASKHAGATSVTAAAAGRAAEAGEAPLARASAAPSLGDEFGPDLGYLRTEAEAEGGDGRDGLDGLGAAQPAATDVEAAGAGRGTAGPLAAAGRLQPSELAVRAAGARGRCGCFASRSAAASCWPQPPAGPDCDGSGEDGGAAAVARVAAVARRIAWEESLLLPPLQVGLLVVILVSVAATNIPAGFLIECGTASYWLASLSPLAVMLLVFIAARRHVLWKGAWKAALGLGGAGDLSWGPRTTLVYPAVCISAGVIAGLLGLGGGLVLTPLMLELGVNPSVSAASTQVTLLISSSTSAIVYAVNDAIPWDWGAALIAIGFVATLLGQWLVSWLVRRLGRPSVLVIILAVMFAASTGAVLAVVVTTAVDLARHPAKLSARKGVCPTFH